MTVCIVHRDGWAVTDSRSLMGHLIVPDAPKKAFVAGDYIVAVAGSGATSHKIMNASRSVHSYEVPEKISEILEEEDNGSEALLVHKTRELSHLDSGGCHSLLEPEYEFWIIGSAENAVRGYLNCIQDGGRKLTPEDACAAIKSAAKLDVSIDDRCQIVRLNG